MRFFLSLLLICTNCAKAQTISATGKIATFTQVWGFLKYYHPEVANGKQDWDSVFMVKIKTLYTLNDKESINKFYSEWINSLGEVSSCKSCKQRPGIEKNFDNSWLSDEMVFTADVIKQLKWIETNRNTGGNYYAGLQGKNFQPNFDNEKAYADSVFPSPEMRLLALARYWNAIQYYFPYKYAIGKDWKSVLPEFIPKFHLPADTISYHLTFKELVAAINDSHANIATPYTGKWVGRMWVPFMFEIIDNKAVAFEFFNDTLARLNDIELGDVFLTVNNKPVSEIIKEKWKYSSGSNDAAKMRGMSSLIFNGHSDTVHVSYERDGVIKEKTITRYPYSRFNYTYFNGGPDSFRILPGNIGYVNLGWLQISRVDEIMKLFTSTKAIIFDVRAYPNDVLFKLADHLNPEAKPFVKFMRADKNLPGDYNYTIVRNCGRKNKNYYKGKTILLFNEYSQSHAEFTLMALKTAPNVLSIGSQSSVADGNVSYIILPGNYKTAFTALGVYYPDGSETQRVGILPDIFVRPTIANIRAGKDDLMERAIMEAGKQ